MISDIAKYTANPVFITLSNLGVLPSSISILQTVGRKSGRIRRVPVGGVKKGNTIWLVSEHGYQAAYVQNIIADPHVKIKVGRKLYSGTAHLMPEDDPLERTRIMGLKINGAVVRTIGKAPMTIRIELEP